MKTRWWLREWLTVAALADAHNMINNPKAKKERIAFAPMKTLRLSD
jgi:hypothetical protein